METKSLPFEYKDLDKSSRTAVIRHSVYNDIDRTKDIARKGMFTRSWNASKDDIAFYLNHNDELSPGKVTNVKEDDTGAYTEVKMGTHTLGNDTLIMMDEGIIRKASFGYIVEKKNSITVNGQKVRELKEVQHIETSVLTKAPAHIKAGVVSVVKSLEFKKLSQPEQAILAVLAQNTQGSMEELARLSGTLDVSSDLFTWILWVIERHSSLLGEFRSQLRYNATELKAFKSHISTMEKFATNTKASDDCIKSILDNIEEAKSLISEYDTDDTRLIPDQLSSKNDEELVVQLKQLNQLFKQN